MSLAMHDRKAIKPKRARTGADLSRVRLGIVFLAAIACASRMRTTPVDAPLVAAGATEASGATGGRTPSTALDRITKREPRLDSTVRRAGSGRGVTIYVFDGGIATDHPELAGRVRRGFDAFPDGPRTCNAHGTAVAGAAAGRTLGVAPQAEVVDVKMISCERLRGSVRAILAATQWVIDDHRWHPERPAVVNWSFVVDTQRTVPAIDSAVAMLREAGMLVVASAGNLDIDACAVSPASAAGTLVVGASSLRRASPTGPWRDERTPRTAWGRCVDVYAPGDSVLLPTIDESGAPIATVWTGTSMSAGYASGAAALLLEQVPSATPDLIAQLIKLMATPDVIADSEHGSASAIRRLLYVGPQLQAMPVIRHLARGWPIPR